MNWTDDLLFELALGVADQATTRAFNVSLETDQELADRYAEVLELTSALPTDIADLAPPAGGRERLVEGIGHVNRFGYLAGRVVELLGVTEDRALEWLSGLDEPSNWGPGVLPGTTMWTVPTERENVGIVWLKMPAGMEFPHHEHLGSEEVLVVQGRYIDHRGVLHPPGAVLREHESSEHSFHIDAQGPDFICLAIVEGGIRIGDVDVTRETLYGA
jgi:hypothetical protein